MSKSVTPVGKQAWEQCQAMAEGSLLLLCLVATLAFPVKPAHATDPQETIERVKLSVVAIGTFLKSRSPEVVLTGAGFAVADGRYVVTAASPVSRPLDVAQKEILVVLVSVGGQPQPREAQLLSVDKDHNLALLRISGDPLPALRLGDSATVREGQMLMFTGFSPSTALGLYPATHRSMVSAIMPAMFPGTIPQQLTASEISRIRESRYAMFQLDAKAYPGNAGSPLYHPDDGRVYGIISRIFVLGGPENSIGSPSGITYAIPSRHIRELLQRGKIPVLE